MLSPEQILSICRDVSIIYFSDHGGDDHSQEYETKRKFTAFMLCCSFVLVKTYLIDKKDPDPSKDDFYKLFVALLIKEAYQVEKKLPHSVPPMFDIEMFGGGESPEKKVMTYLKYMAASMIRAIQTDEIGPIANLAYNYYMQPGTLTYNGKNKLKDTKKLAEFTLLISSASNTIFSMIL
jgi:hypothetical protein